MRRAVGPPPPAPATLRSSPAHPPLLSTFLSFLSLAPSSPSSPSDHLRLQLPRLRLLSSTSSIMPPLHLLPRLPLCGPGRLAIALISCGRWTRASTPCARHLHASSSSRTSRRRKRSSRRLPPTRCSAERCCASRRARCGSSSITYFLSPITCRLSPITYHPSPITYSLSHTSLGLLLLRLG